MAITIEGSASAAPSAAPAATAAPGGNAPVSGGISTYADALQRAANYGVIGQSVQVQEYKTRLREELNRTPLKDAELIDLVSAAGCTLLKYRNVGVVLVFAEDIALPTNYDNKVRPYSTVSTAALAAVKNMADSTGQEIAVINSIVITSNEYKHVTSLVTRLSLEINCLLDADIRGLNASALATANLYTTTDLSSIMNWVRQVHPHAHLPRADIGIMLFARNNRNKDIPLQNDINSHQDNGRPIVAVTGYVDIVEATANTAQYGYGQNTAKYVPIVHITGMFAPLPHMSAGILGLTLAGDQFIHRNGWMQAFRNFDPKAQRANLGNLTFDPTDKSGAKLAFLQNDMQMQDFIRNNMAPPVLVIDQCEGMDRMSHVASMCEPTLQAKAVEAISHFFGTQANFQHICGTGWNEHVGTVGEGAQIMDSRCAATYLDRVAYGGALSAEVARALLSINNDANVRADILRSSGLNFKALYNNTVSVVNPHAVTWMINALKASRVEIRTDVANTGIIGTDVLLGNGWSDPNLRNSMGLTTYAGGNNTFTGGVYSTIL